jgi:hypothetical protein
MGDVMSIAKARVGFVAALLAVVTAVLLFGAVGVARSVGTPEPDFTPAGSLAVVEAGAEGPRGVLPEVRVVAEGPQLVVGPVEAAATAVGPGRGEMPVVEVRARRPDYAGFSLPARDGGLGRQAN